MNGLGRREYKDEDRDSGGNGDLNELGENRRVRREDLQQPVQALNRVMMNRTTQVRMATIISQNMRTPHHRYS